MSDYCEVINKVFLLLEKKMDGMQRQFGLSLSEFRVQRHLGLKFSNMQTRG